MQIWRVSKGASATLVLGSYLNIKPCPWKICFSSIYTQHQRTPKPHRTHQLPSTASQSSHKPPTTLKFIADFQHRRDAEQSWTRDGGRKWYHHFIITNHGQHVRTFTGYSGLHEPSGAPVTAKLFSNLPIEIQQMIWDHVLSNPRVFTVFFEHTQLSSTCYYSPRICAAVPLILHVNQNTREHGLKHLHPCLIQQENLLHQLQERHSLLPEIIAPIRLSGAFLHR